MTEPNLALWRLLGADVLAAVVAEVLVAEVLVADEDANLVPVAFAHLELCAFIAIIARQS